MQITKSFFKSIFISFDIDCTFANKMSSSDIIHLQVEYAAFFAQVFTDIKSKTTKEDIYNLGM